MFNLARRAKKLERQLEEYRDWAYVLWAAAKNVHARQYHLTDIRYAVDTSEILRYATLRDAPNYRERVSRATLLAVALDMMFFRQSPALYLLPPHRIELSRHVKTYHAEWARKLKARNQLEMLRESLLSAVEGASDFTVDSVVTFIKNTSLDPKNDHRRSAIETTLRTIFGLWETGRIVPFFDDCLSHEHIEYVPNSERISWLTEAFSSERQRRSYNDRADAEAWDFLVWVNDNIPDRQAVVLLSHGPAASSVIQRASESRLDIPKRLFRHNMPLVQPPEILLCHKLWGLDGPRRAETASELTFDLFGREVVFSKWDEVRSRMHDLRNRFGGADGIDRAPLDIDLLNAYEQRMRSVQQMRQRAVRLLMGSAVVSKHDTDLTAVMERHDIDVDEIARCLGAELGEAGREASAIETTWLLSAWPKSLWKDLRSQSRPNDARLVWLHDLRPGIATTEYWLHSFSAISFVDRIVGEAQGEPLERILVECESKLADKEPDYYLLLALAYSSRGHEHDWILGVGAARIGLSFLRDNHDALAWRELKLAEATGLSRWGAARLRQSESLSRTAGTLLLRQAKEALADCDSLISTASPAARDSLELASFTARVYREMGFVAGRLGEVNEKESDNRANEAIEYAVKAWGAARDHWETMPVAVYVANNVVYACTEGGVSRDSQYESLCSEAVERLEALGDCRLPDSAHDSVGWYWWKSTVYYEQRSEPKEKVVSCYSKSVKHYKHLIQNRRTSDETILMHAQEVLSQQARYSD